MSRIRSLLVALLALPAVSVIAGCGSGPEPAPTCIDDALVLQCSATAVFCRDGAPDSAGACPGGSVTVDPYEPTPGAGDACTTCVRSHTGEREDPAVTCDRLLCESCRTAARPEDRCARCDATVVSVGSERCPMAMLRPGPTTTPPTGTDAGPPPPPLPAGFLVQSFAYGGGTSLAGDPVAEFELDAAELGTPTAISADELLWIGFSDSHLRGFEITTGHVEIDLDLSSFVDSSGALREPLGIISLQVYRSPADTLMAVVGFGAMGGVARIEIDEIAHAFRPGPDFVQAPFATDARIHPLPALVDEGYVVAVSATGPTLIVIPRVDDPGRFVPGRRMLSAIHTPFVVAPEAVADGLVWTGERNACGSPGSSECGRVGAFRSTCPDPSEPATCLPEVSTTTLSSTQTVMGFGGPDQPFSSPTELYAGLNTFLVPGDSVGVIAALDPVTLDVLSSHDLRSPISNFVTRTAGVEVYAFLTTTASRREGAELMAVIPTAPSGLEPVARRTLSSADVVLDLAVGVEAFVPPPEPHEPIPFESVDAVLHLLTFRP